MHIATIDLAEGLGDYLSFLDADDEFVITGSIPEIKIQIAKSLHPCNTLHAPSPAPDSIILRTGGVQWKATFEVSVSAFCTGAMDEVMIACEEILFHPDVPEEVKKLTRENKRFYNQALSNR